MQKAKETIKNQDGFAVTCASIIDGVISFFILLLVVVFPLIYHNSYFDILETKYQCYWMLVVGMLGVCLVLSLIMMIVDFMEFKGEHTKQLFSRLHPRQWKETFSISDVAVAVFLLTALISTLLSDYVYEAFWGNEGRYTGLFLLTLYVCSYFLISRCWKLKGWLLEAFLISGMIMCIIGITDYFQMDVLGFRSGRTAIQDSQSTMFTSTVGNINTYTAYVALIMALAGTMFATVKKGFRMLWYYVCMVIAFFAIIMGCSDNAYLALGAWLGLLPLLLFKNRDGLIRYLMIVASFFSVIQIIDWLNQVYVEKVIGLDSLFQVIVNLRGLLFAVILLWGIAAWAWFRGKKNGISEEQENKYLVYIWVGFLGVVFALLCFVLYDANFAGNAERYEALSAYLVFDDDWGTRRGYIWRKTIELYREFTPKQKLFGYGPDTFGILTTKEIRLEMVASTGQIFDNVHNEYLQYLITVGPIGLVAYVIFLGGAMKKMWQNIKANSYVIGCCFAVICYGVQALVNLNLPIATPMMWLLLSIGSAAIKHNFKA